MKTVVVKARPTVTMVGAVPDTVVTVKGLPGAGPPGPPGSDGAGSATIHALLTGTQDGSNTVFTTSASIDPGTERIWVNGLLQRVTIHYAATGNEITFSDPPEPGDWLAINYQEAKNNGNNANHGPSN